MVRRMAAMAAAGFLWAASGYAEPPAVDNSYYDWQDRPAIAAFSDHYNPVFFSRESGGKRETLPIERALYWNRGGTRLGEIKAVIDGTSLYLYVRSVGAMAPEVSVFGYAYRGRQPGSTNQYALELMPGRDGSQGFVALWTPDGRAVRAGELAGGSVALECRIDLSLLPGDIPAAGGLSFDVTTCYHERASGTYEEFFFTTLYLEDLTG